MNYLNDAQAQLVLRTQIVPASVLLVHREYL